jgi:hypothetical protein
MCGHGLMVGSPVLAFVPVTGVGGRRFDCSSPPHDENERCRKVPSGVWLEYGGRVARRTRGRSECEQADRESGGADRRDGGFGCRLRGSR